MSARSRPSTSPAGVRAMSPLAWIRLEARMSPARVLCVAVLLAIGTTTAWAQKVQTDANQSVNFSSFKTYFWAKTDPLPGNDITNQRIMDAVDRGMASHGWTKAPEGQADLAVV